MPQIMDNLLSYLLLISTSINAGLCSEDVTCFCSSALCAKSDYLCYSKMGCFKEQLPKPSFLPVNEKSSSWYPSVRTGCLEHIPVDKFYKCWSDDVWEILKNPSKIRVPGQLKEAENDDAAGANSDVSHKAASKKQNDDALMCCFEDYCNEPRNAHIVRDEEEYHNQMNSVRAKQIEQFTLPVVSFTVCVLSLLIISTSCAYLYYKWKSYSRRRQPQRDDVSIVDDFFESTPVSSSVMRFEADRKGKLVRV